jgi:hypothetical protein
MCDVVPASRRSGVANDLTEGLRGHTTTSSAKNPLEAGDVASPDCGTERIEKTSSLG